MKPGWKRPDRRWENLSLLGSEHTWQAHQETDYHRFLMQMSRRYVRQAMAKGTGSDLGQKLK
jgi:hypothetical protein